MKTVKIPKPYVRGDFRAVKVQPKPEDHPNYWCYDVQARTYRNPKEWVTINSFDYWSNARLRVRNLHAACCILGPVAVTADNCMGQERAEQVRRYLKTGKLMTPKTLKQLRSGLC